MKTVITFMVLVSVCGGLLELLPKCQPDHNDCSCNDKSFKDCQEPTAEQEESVENLEQCLAKCEEFSAVGVCEWVKSCWGWLFDEMYGVLCWKLCLLLLC